MLANLLLYVSQMAVNLVIYCLKICHQYKLDKHIATGIYVQNSMQNRLEERMPRLLNVCIRCCSHYPIWPPCKFVTYEILCCM